MISNPQMHIVNIDWVLNDSILCPSLAVGCKMYSPMAANSDNIIVWRRWKGRVGKVIGEVNREHNRGSYVGDKSPRLRTMKRYKGLKSQYGALVDRTLVVH